MNNLLRTLTQRRGASSLQDTDLRLLLTTVKDTRRQHAEKLSDPFYDSLEGLLHDLRTVTVDNRDAEAFLKPVAKQDAADYYDIIMQPMDLGTMLKKVKAKSYKSKKEFADDLNLIWENCYQYNAAEEHPLRHCVTRLRAKANTLLAHITDRRERADPNIDRALGAPLAGVAQVKAPSHAPPTRPGSSASAARPTAAKLRSAQAVVPSRPVPTPSVSFLQETPFAEMPALVRTPEGMGEYVRLQREVEKELEREQGQPVPEEGKTLEEKMKELVKIEESADEWAALEGGVGEKRKMNGEARPRKRVRVGLNQDPAVAKEATELWWDVVNLDQFAGNGVPPTPYCIPPRSLPPLPTLPRGSEAGPSSFKPKKKKMAVATKDGAKQGEGSKKTMLALMSDNIRTVKRVRRAHTKLAALAALDDLAAQPGANAGAVLALMQPDVEDAGAAVKPDEGVDDRPWRTVVGEKGGLRRRKVDNGVGRVDAEAAENCLEWMSGRVLEHAGFQGMSKIAHGVLASVAAEYLSNVGRTMRLMVDKYAQKMNAEEIILHTLFESGITEVQDLDRYVHDDVLRYGTRMGELEKKLVNAYAEATVAVSGDAMDDDTMFAERDGDEEDGQFVMGSWADALGDDFFGLKSLGIADEYGLASLTIPRKLLRARRQALAGASSSSGAIAKEPVPYPPPPSLEPLRAGRAEDQIGLLQPYFNDRFVALAATLAPPAPDVTAAALAALPPMPGITLPSAFTLPPAPASASTSTPSAPPPPPPELALPEETPEPARCKLGPLGQVLKAPNAPAGATGASGAGANAAKKKAQAVTVKKEVKETPRPVGRPPKNKAGGVSGTTPTPTPAPAVGTGKKKKAIAPAPPPGGAEGASQGGQMVTASA